MTTFNFSVDLLALCGTINVAIIALLYRSKKNADSKPDSPKEDYKQLSFYGKTTIVGAYGREFKVIGTGHDGISIHVETSSMTQMMIAPPSVNGAKTVLAIPYGEQFYKYFPDHVEEVTAMLKVRVEIEKAKKEADGAEQSPKAAW